MCGILVHYIGVICTSSWKLNDIISDNIGAGANDNGNGGYGGLGDVVDNSAKALSKLLQCFIDLISVSQRYLRKHLFDVSVVSLRDVQRCNKFFLWFYKSNNRSNKLNIYQRITESIILSLAQTYYFRLNEFQRIGYCQLIESNFVDLLLFGFGANSINFKIFQSNNNNNHRSIFGRGSNNSNNNSKNHKKTIDFYQTFIQEERQYVSMLKLARGIALNRAFMENLYVILIALLTKTPLIVVGKPGSSKTLAMTTIQNNLSSLTKNEKLTNMNINDYFVVSFQCSKLTTAKLIEERWNYAVNIEKNIK